MIILFLLSFLIATSAHSMELAPKNEGLPLQQLPNGPITEIANQIARFDISDASYALRALACTSRELNEKINNSETTKQYVQSLIDNHPDFFKPYPQSAWPSIAAILIGTEQTKSLIDTPELQAMPKVGSTISQLVFLMQYDIRNSKCLFKESTCPYPEYCEFIDQKENGELFFFKTPTIPTQPSHCRILESMKNHILPNPYIYFFCIKHSKNRAMQFIFSYRYRRKYLYTDVQDLFLNDSALNQLQKSNTTLKLENFPLCAPLFINYLVQTGQNYFFSAIYKREKTPLALAFECKFPTSYIEAYLQQIPDDNLNTTIDYCSKSTVLGKAACFNRCSIVKTLVSLGADPTVSDPKINPVLFSSIYRHCTDCVKTLIQAHGGLSECPKETPHIAALNGNITIINMLHKLDPSSINWRDPNNSTPLICAIGHGEYKAAKRLLLLGANPNLAFKTIKKSDLEKISVGSTALSRLITNKIMRYKEKYVDSKGFLTEEKDMLQALISHGANPNIPRQDGFLPLHIISNNKPLFSYCARDFFDSWAQSEVKALPLKEQYEIAKILVGGGADRNKKDKFGRTPLMLFLTTYAYEMVSCCSRRMKHDCINGWVFSKKEKLKPENNEIISDIIHLLVTPENVCDVDPETNMNLQDYLDHFGIEPTAQIIPAQQEWEKQAQQEQETLQRAKVFGSWALGTTALIAIKFFTKH